MRVLALLLGLAWVSGASAQSSVSLQQLFLLLPDSVALNQTQAERQQALAAFIDRSIQSGTADCRIRVLDTANAYLSMRCAEVDGNWEMAAWTTSEAKLLVAVSVTQCEPECDGRLYVFVADSGAAQKLTPASNVMPELTVADLVDVQQLSPEDRAYLQEAPPGILYRLPRKHNGSVTVVLDAQGAEDIPAKARRSISFIWQDGRFVRAADN